MSRAIFLSFITAIILSGCRIEVDVPAEGGKVLIQAEARECTDKKRCVIEVTDSKYFNEFRAISDEGYKFSHWRKKQNALCGKKKGVCEVVVPPSTGSIADVVGGLLRGSKSYSVEPVFKRLDSTAPVRLLFDDALAGVAEESLRQCLQNNRQAEVYADELYELSCPPATRVTLLDGIEQFSSLANVELLGARIKDLRPLADLEFLFSLSLHGGFGRTYTKPYNLTASGIGKLDQINSLSIGNHLLDDFSVFVRLEGLRSLTLRGNNISNIAFLNQIPNLYQLDLNNNNITDISNLEGFNQLTRFSVAENQITDASPVNGMTALTHLILSGNQVEDVSMLGNLRELVTFDINRTGVTDFSVIENMDKLELLGISHNGITDISALEARPKLDWLTISSNPIDDFSVLSVFTRLQYLDAHQVGLEDEDIGFLANNPNLTTFLANSNNISDLSPLRDLEHLTRVALVFNNIERLEDNLDNMKSGLLTLNANPLNCQDFQSFLQRKPDELEVVFPDQCTP